MLNFQVAAPKDLKEAARIEKTRQYEEQRKARIFNPRQRLIGVGPLKIFVIGSLPLLFLDNNH